MEKGQPQAVPCPRRVPICSPMSGEQMIRCFPKLFRQTLKHFPVGLVNGRREPQRQFVAGSIGRHGSSQ